MWEKVKFYFWKLPQWEYCEDKKKEKKEEEEVKEKGNSLELSMSEKKKGYLVIQFFPTCVAVQKACSDAVENEENTSIISFNYSERGWCVHSCIACLLFAQRRSDGFRSCIQLVLSFMLLIVCYLCKKHCP